MLAPSLPFRGLSSCLFDGHGCWVLFSGLSYIDLFSLKMLWTLVEASSWWDSDSCVHHYQKSRFLIPASPGWDFFRQELPFWSEAWGQIWWLSQMTGKTEQFCFFLLSFQSANQMVWCLLILTKQKKNRDWKVEGTLWIGVPLLQFSVPRFHFTSNIFYTLNNFRLFVHC